MKKEIDISRWNRGVLKCVCGRELPFSSDQGLDMLKCPACGDSSFVPYKVSKFWLFQPLGGGGMGAVYKAVPEDGRIFCAVKILPRRRRSDPEFIKNLLVEINAAEKFGNHNNLVKLIAAGKSPEGEYFMATEFIEGERLDRYVEARHQLTEREAFAIMLQIFEAEKHICSCGYLFRDIKPENVIIEKHGRARLFDYGLCKPIDKETGTGDSAAADQIEGSPYYLPPERIVGATEGEYSEIYSMGMLFFYMLAGRTYYSESEINDLVVKHLTAIRIVSTAPHLRNCRSKTVQTIDKMIQRNPNSRFPDFALLEIAFKDLEKELAGHSRRKWEPEIREERFENERTAHVLSERRPLSKNAKFAIAAVLGLLFLGAGVYLAVSTFRSMEKKRRISHFRMETAKMLGVPEDIAPPSLPREEIEKIVRQKADERMAILKDSIRDFNEDEAIKKICKRLKIERFARKRPRKSMAELKSEAEEAIRKTAEDEFRKTFPPFDAKKAEEDISRKFGLALPPAKPSDPIEKAQEDLKRHLKSLVDEKFGLKTLSAEIKRIHEQYAPYSPGQDVKLLLPSGQIIEGKFVADLGSKLLVGCREILKKDLLPEERMKFDEDMSAKKISELVAKARQDFARQKKEYASKIEKEEEVKFLASRGYFKNSRGSWVSGEELLREELARARAEYSIRSELARKKIEDEALKNFDMEKFFSDSGYVLVEGKWVSEFDVVEKELENERKDFAEKREAEIRELRKNSENLIRQDIYKKNNYVFYAGDWQAADKLIQKIVEERMNERK